MKTKFLTWSMIVGLMVASCSKSNDETPAPTPVTGEITGTFTSDKTFPKGTYTLKGIVKIASGATVTFEAGSTITSDKATGDNALIALLGGKLNVNGTADQPVVFTSVNTTPGSWGGITIYGDAPITALNGAPSAVSEDGNALPYGGSNAAHNGGSLKYCRVEYAGSKLADGTKETNGFTFYSCGTGTTLDHLVSYKGADDGYEFFGGTASMTNAVSYGNYDDAFDWQDGWRGQLNSNWYAYQTSKGNFGMEIESSLVNNTFGPKVTNITLKRETGTTPEVPGDIQVDAFQFKRQGNGDFSNIVLVGYLDYTENATTYKSSIIKIQDQVTNDDQLVGGKIKLTNIKTTNVSNEITGAANVVLGTFPTGNYTAPSTTATGADITAGNWAKVGNDSLIK